MFRAGPMLISAALVASSLASCRAFVSSSCPGGLMGGRSAVRGLRSAGVARPHMQRRGTGLRMMSDGDFADWKADTTFLFPGQGAQYVGMAGQLVQDVPKAKELFDKAADVLGYDLLKICVEGPKEKLDSTVYSQPAIYVSSLAAVERLRQDAGDEAIDKATVAAGLSLGEYTALCFAGAISFEDGLKVVKVRGEAMQAASEAQESGMVSIIGLDVDVIKQVCEKASEMTGSKIQIANYLCPGNYAVSGAKDACAKVAEIAKPEFKARMTVPLAVAGAFHTDFMQPAVPALEKALSEIEIKKPRIPVISNVDAKPHSDPEVIKSILTKQVTSPVLWENTIKDMMERGYKDGYELGPGKVVAGIVKRVNKAAAITNIEA
uniref:Malonyl-CoA:ACP transacylase (MAT) domain-containing protein n=1 Tax=Hemiselmis tepida TaxID=464990 RepID=A0A7S0W1A9_9CRYP|mmetsp:Transcript_36527/g.93292  ORF Transcript_36527/g.93292 Transcript_36527/m.93292 type:complete len:378 (+) Transcript_36527:19-1152(+)